MVPNPTKPSDATVVTYQGEHSMRFTVPVEDADLLAQAAETFGVQRNSVTHFEITIKCRPEQGWSPDSVYDYDATYHIDYTTETTESAST